MVAGIGYTITQVEASPAGVFAWWNMRVPLMVLRVARFNGDVHDLRLALVKGQGCEGYQLSLAQAISSLACLTVSDR
jgi:hypothetical protein